MLTDLITKLDEGHLVFVLILAIIAAVLIVKAIAVMLVQLVHGHEGDDVEIDRQTDALRDAINSQTSDLLAMLETMGYGLIAIRDSNEYLAEREREAERDEARRRGESWRTAASFLHPASIDGADEAVDLTKTKER